MLEDLIQDRAALEDKVDELDAFRHDPTFNTITREEQICINRQVHLMQDLVDILNQRIAINRK